MSLINAQIRASSFWRSGEKKVSPLQGPIKQMMLRGAHGRPCPICGIMMLHHPNTTIDHTMPSAATIEHILPRSLGGTHEGDNLSTICNGCNRARGMVYSDLKLTNETIREYVAWLFLQIDDPIEASRQFPVEHGWFCRRWQSLYNMNYNPPGQRMQITQNGKRRTLDMSASARERRTKRGI